MDVWIARDFDSGLFMHFSEPVRSDISGKHWQSYPYQHMINIDGTPIAEKYKTLKYTDAPVKLKIKI